MENVIEDVMNNYDLRSVIWKFLRKKPYKRCTSCKVVLMWNSDKTIIKYVEYRNILRCHKCYLELVNCPIV